MSMGLRKLAKLLEGFNEPALKVLMLAQEEAFRLKHSECDTGEVLIALITDGDEARRSLVEYDANAEIVRSMIEKTLGPWDGKKLPIPIPFSSQTTQVLERARVWSCEMSNEYVRPGHILLGILDLRNSVAFQVLEQMTISPEKLQNRIKEELAVVTKQQVESAE